MGFSFIIALYFSWTWALLVFKVSFQCRTQGLGCLMWGTNHSVLRESVSDCFFRSLPIASPYTDFWWHHVCATPTHLHMALLSFLWNSLSDCFEVLFRGCCSIRTCTFVVSVGRAFGIILSHHLEPPSQDLRFFVPLSTICFYSDMHTIIKDHTNLGYFMKTEQIVC